MKKVTTILVLALSLFLFSSKASAEIGIELVELKPITLKANVSEEFNYDLYVMLGFENNKNGVYRLSSDEGYCKTINVREGDIYLRAYQVTYGQESSKDVTSCFNLTGSYENDEFIINVEQISDIEPSILPNRNYDGTKNEDLTEDSIDNSKKITNNSTEKIEKVKTIAQEEKLAKENSKINIIPIIVIILAIAGILIIFVKLYKNNKKIK